MNHLLGHNIHNSTAYEFVVPEVSNAIPALLLLSPSLQPILLNHKSGHVLSRLKEKVSRPHASVPAQIRKIPPRLMKFAKNLHVIHQARQSSGPVSPTVLSKRVKGIGAPFLLHGCTMTWPASRDGVYVLVWIEEGGRLSSSQSRPRGSALPKLTPREQSVLHALSEGATDQEIATRLDLSLHTIKKYTKILRLKIGVKNRAGLVRHVFTKSR